jgi:type VI secretion system protein VasD
MTVVKRFEFARLGARWAVAAGVVGLLASCAHAPPTPPGPCAQPEPLRVSLRASPHLNPSEKGEPLATVVRVYQLKGIGKIGGASFDDLLDHDRETLGEDFVAVQEVTVAPGATLDPPLVRNGDATHVAVVALFRRPVSTVWRAVEKLPPPDPQYCHAPPPGGKGDGKTPPPKDPTLRFRLDESQIATVKSS